VTISEASRCRAFKNEKFIAKEDIFSGNEPGLLGMTLKSA